MRERGQRIRNALVAVAGAALLATALVTVEGQEGGGIVPVPDPPGAFAVRPDRGEGAWYRPGDVIAFDLDIPEAGYLTVYDVTPSGRVQVIFPHTWEASTHVAAGRVRLPRPGAGWHYQVTGGPGGRGGTECVIAVLSPTPFPPPTWLPETRLSAADAGLAPAEVASRRAGETAEVNARIVCGPGPRPPGWSPPPHYVARTWLRIAPVRPYR